MNGVPHIFTPTEIREHAMSTQTTMVDRHDGSETVRWVPVRPCTYPGWKLLTRIKRAWLVFTGQADVLKWEA